ncbi:hypothetical protein E2C01_003428 [Portunus trituberculatus]|uniref:Uncharacterized protein n=1 Tax=Portunus trituberculatus TaxID=210409 RepID=A0A5B7CMB4_PORTR|nr:hypothetical protein [Portunus trituberculatus]
MQREGVQQRLGDVGVEVRNAGGEGRDVLGEAVVGVLQPTVQVGHAVVTLVAKIQVVGVLDEAGTKGERQMGLQEADHGVDEGGGHGDTDPLGHHECKLSYVLPNDVLDHAALQLRHID